MESAGKWENAMRSLVVGVLSVIWHLITQHVNLIVMAALTWTYFLIWPVAYVIGIPRWKPLDVYFKIYSHFVILQNIELLGVKLYFYGGFPDICDKEENSVIIANHQSESIMEKTGNLSRVRGVFKEALIWLPFFGFFMHARGILYVDRTDVNWKNFDAACRKLHRKKIPFSMLIYPEGTVMNWALDERNVWEKNRAYARSNGEQPFEYVLFPRYRGLFRLLKHLRGNTQALYDFTIIYESTRTGNGFRRRTPSIFDIAAIAGSAVHIHLRRIDIKDVPEEEEEFKRFLIERFAFKERLLDAFYKTGALPKDGVRLPAQNRRHSLVSLVFFLAGASTAFSWAAITMLPYFVGIPALIMYTLGAILVIIPEKRTWYPNPFKF